MKCSTTVDADVRWLAIRLADMEVRLRAVEQAMSWPANTTVDRRKIQSVARAVRRVFEDLGKAPSS